MVNDNDKALDPKAQGDSLRKEPDETYKELDVAQHGTEYQNNETVYTWRLQQALNTVAAAIDPAYKGQKITPDQMSTITQQAGAMREEAERQRRALAAAVGSFAPQLRDRATPEAVAEHIRLIVRQHHEDIARISSVIAEVHPHHRTPANVREIPGAVREIALHYQEKEAQQTRRVIEEIGGAVREVANIEQQLADIPSLVNTIRQLRQIIEQQICQAMSAVVREVEHPSAALETSQDVIIHIRGLYEQIQHLKQELTKKVRELDRMTKEARKIRPTTSEFKSLADVADFIGDISARDRDLVKLIKQTTQRFNRPTTSPGMKRRRNDPKANVPLTDDLRAAVRQMNGLLLQIDDRHGKLLETISQTALLIDPSMTQIIDDRAACQYIEHLGSEYWQAEQARTQLEVESQAIAQDLSKQKENMDVARLAKRLFSPFAIRFTPLFWSVLLFLMLMALLSYRSIPDPLLPRFVQRMTLVWGTYPLVAVGAYATYHLLTQWRVRRKRSAPLFADPVHVILGRCLLHGSVGILYSLFVYICALGLGLIVGISIASPPVTTLVRDYQWQAFLFMAFGFACGVLSGMLAEIEVTNVDIQSLPVSTP